MDDIDVVLVATPDHWHDIISIDAMKAGKAIYCEKPMVQEVKEGHEVIKAEAKYNAKFQVGSQGVSSIQMQKAKEIYEAGEIGELILVEAAYDRHSSLGAWQYSIPRMRPPKRLILILSWVILQRCLLIPSRFSGGGITSSLVLV